MRFGSGVCQHCQNVLEMFARIFVCQQCERLVRAAPSAFPMLAAGMFFKRVYDKILDSVGAIVIAEYCDAGTFAQNTCHTRLLREFTQCGVTG